MVAESADALASEASSRKRVRVQVSPTALLTIQIEISMAERKIVIEK